MRVRQLSVSLSHYQVTLGKFTGSQETVNSLVRQTVGAGKLTHWRRGICSYHKQLRRDGTRRKNGKQQIELLLVGHELYKDMSDEMLTSHL